MSLLWIVVIGLGAMAVSLAWRGFRDRVHNRRTALSESTRGPRLSTHIATFVFDRSAGKIWLERPGLPPAHIELRDVRGVQVRVGYTEAALEELFIEGMHWTDLRAEYRDHRMTWAVVLNTRHGPVTLALLSQYKKRDWFDFSTPLQHAMLRLIGQYQTGEVVAARIENEVRMALRSAGLQVLGGYGSIATTGALEGAPLPAEADLGPAAPLSAVELPPVEPGGIAPWPSATGPRRGSPMTDRDPED